MQVENRDPEIERQPRQGETPIRPVPTYGPKDLPSSLDEFNEEAVVLADCELAPGQAIACLDELPATVGSLAAPYFFGSAVDGASPSAF